jgi:hypothetical protein
MSPDIVVFVLAFAGSFIGGAVAIWLYKRARDRQP